MARGSGVDFAFYGCSGLISVIFRVGSTITTAWGSYTFGNSTYTGSKAGTYTRSSNTWTQQSQTSEAGSGSAVAKSKASVPR